MFLPFIYTGCILSEKTPADGLRISVMIRHTLNDGVTPDTRITNYDYHESIFGPSPQLIGDYYKRALPWKQFEVRYFEELRTKEKKQHVAKLARQAVQQTITLLCIEEEALRCHRRLLAEECQTYEPSLIIVHR